MVMYDIVQMVNALSVSMLFIPSSMYINGLSHSFRSNISNFERWYFFLLQLFVCETFKKKLMYYLFNMFINFFFLFWIKRHVYGLTLMDAEHGC